MTHTAGLPAGLPACVGTANNANMGCCLHELTIVSLLHELKMVANGCGPGGEGGEGRRKGPTATEASRTKFFGKYFFLLH